MRRLKFMSQTKLAKKAGVTVKHIYCICHKRTRPSLELAKKLEEITGVPRLAWLYPEEYNNPYVIDEEED